MVYLASLSRRRSRVQIPHGPFDGSVAQLVEQWIEAPCVGGSIPSRAIENGGIAKWLNAAVCKTALSEFGGSNPLASIAEFYSAGCIEQQVKVQSNGL